LHAALLPKKVQIHEDKECKTTEGWGMQKYRSKYPKWKVSRVNSLEL
jgi:hypothetical protein